MVKVKHYKHDYNCQNSNSTRCESPVPRATCYSGLSLRERYKQAMETLSSWNTKMRGLVILYEASAISYVVGHSNLWNQNYMLIDGGPASNEPMYTTPTQARVKFNLFYTLNRLSGSTQAAGTTPPANAMKKIDTLVLTHDDVDHKRGTWLAIDSVVSSNELLFCRN